MPQATLDRPATAPTTPMTVPAPRPEAHQNHDPNAWVGELSRSEIALALAVSDMPRTRQAQEDVLGQVIPVVWPTAPGGQLIPARLTPSGARTINAWAAQGVKRAGGEVVLWEAANTYRTLNRTGAWHTPAGKAFAKRFGGMRRIYQVNDKAGYVLAGPAPTELWVADTAANQAVIDQMRDLYPDRADHCDEGLVATEVVFQASVHDAYMAARSFGRTLVPHIQGGLALV